jgi:hypothetical protein
MSFDEPGKFFDGRPGDSFQGRPGDSFTAGTLKANSDARSAESHARHERRQQEKADSLAAEADAQSRAELAAMAQNDAHAFAMAAGQFRAMMEMCFPALVRLCDQTTSPDSSELFPAVVALGQHGPCWQHPVPEGEKDGNTLEWSEDDHAWLPGTGLPDGEKDRQILVWHKYTAEEKKELETDDKGEWRVEDGFLPDGTTEGQVLRWHKYNQEEKEALQTDRPGEWQPGWVTAIEEES